MRGVGRTVPFSLGGWQTLLDRPPEVAARWALTDLRAGVAACTERSVTQLKDTAAACVAELLAGRGRSIPSFLCVFVDTFIGGGLVLDSHLRAGLRGNAGAIGSLPLALVGASRDAGETPPPQLLNVASLFNLALR